MMGNFFCVTCPYLFELDTVALFPVLRGHHDFATIARIQETTSCLLMCIRTKKIRLYILLSLEPLLPDMYMPYRLNDDNELESLTAVWIWQITTILFIMSKEARRAEY